MKLSAFDRTLLASAEFHPDRTLKELARLLRSKEPTVAYRLSRLREKGVLRRAAIINHAGIGFTNMVVYFSLRSYSEKTFLRLKERMRESARVLWFGSLAGDFQFGMAYLARHPEEVVEFLMQLSEALSLSFSRKQIISRTAHHCFARGYLGKEMKTRDGISMRRPHRQVSLDSLDITILWHLSNSEWRSIRHLSELVKAAPSTVERRVEALVTSEIVRLTYSINPEHLGVASYRLLLRTERIDSRLSEKVHAFCRAQPSTVMLFESVGPWDYEIDIESEHPDSVRKFQQELDAATGGAISEVRVLAELEDYKFTYFPVTSADVTGALEHLGI